MQSWRPRLENGASFSELISSSDQFPDLFRNLYHTGEVSGTLDNTLIRLHTLYQTEGLRRMRALSQWAPKLVYFAVLIFVAWKIVYSYMNSDETAGTPRIDEMTIDEVLSNEELRRHEFPVTRDKIFLSHAAVCALPRRVAEAVRDYALQATLGDQEETMPVAQIQRARGLAGRLLHAQPEEIAFVGPTSLALSFVASGLPWRKGDNLLAYFDDYPSNVYPWMALAEQGVEVRLLNIKEYGRIRAVDVIGQIDEQTRLVALASNHFVAGFRN